jgi:hypothetical protein
MHEITYDLADRPIASDRRRPKLCSANSGGAMAPSSSESSPPASLAQRFDLRLVGSITVRYPRPVLAALECRAVRQLPRQATACAPSPRGCLPPEKGMTITC